MTAHATRLEALVKVAIELAIVRNDLMTDGETPWAVADDIWDSLNGIGTDGPAPELAAVAGERADLLAALKAILPYANASGIDSTEDFGDYYKARDAAKAAVARAEGRAAP